MFGPPPVERGQMPVGQAKPESGRSELRELHPYPKMSKRWRPVLLDGTNYLIEGCANRSDIRDNNLLPFLGSVTSALVA